MNKYFYPLVQNPFSNDDIKKGIDVLKSKQLTLSKQTHNFEKNFSKTLKSKYSLMVNSGSSANLLAFQPYWCHFSRSHSFFSPSPSAELRVCAI